MRNPCQKTLERYLDLRKETLSPVTLKHYRRHIQSLVEFLRDNYPQVDSLAKIRRCPHIESWLRTIEKATINSRRQSLFQVRRFFDDIGKLHWSECPPPGLIRRDDFPPRQHSLRPRRRLKTLSKRLGTLPEDLPENPWHTILERYLETLGETLSPASLSSCRVPILSFLEFLSTRFPRLHSLTNIRRSPHIEGWLREMASRQPPYNDSTRRQYIRYLWQFLKKLNQWGWPESPPAGLIRSDDLPLRATQPRRRLEKFLQTSLNPSPEETSSDRTLKRYLDIRGATLRPGTVSSYRSSILSLITFLRARFPGVDSFGKLRRTPHIEEWLQLLASVEPPYTNDTRRGLIRNVRRFLEDIYEWGWPESPPTGLIRRDDFPPPKRHLPKPLSPEVDVALIEALQRDGDLCSLALLLARRTGLRIGELLRLELDCLSEDSSGHGSLRVPLGKLRTERVIPIDRDTAQLVKTIRTICGPRPATLDPDTARPLQLLLSDTEGKSLPSSRFRGKLKAVTRSLGITENVHPHRLRHSYASELLRNGISLPGLMKLLGHTTLKMTLRYVEVTNEDLGRDYLKAIERARHHYARLKEVSGVGDQPNSPQTIEAAFDQLIAKIQAVRFSDPDPARRKRLQRFVERLRRAQGDLPDLLT